MTVPVPDQLEYISDADGVTKDFPYPKRFLQKDEVVVALRDADGVDTPQTLGTHYTIAGSSWPTGGTVSFITAPQAPNKVVRYRMTQAKQTVVLNNLTRNDAPSVELQLDRLTMAIQDLGRIGGAAWLGLIAEIAARVQGDKILNNRVDQEVEDRIAGDEALASLISNIGSGDAPLFDTMEAVQLAQIASGVKAIRIAGWFTFGDGRDGLFIRVSSEPSHEGKIRSLDGAWWERVSTKVYTCPERLAFENNGSVFAIGANTRPSNSRRGLQIGGGLPKEGTHGIQLSAEGHASWIGLFPSINRSSLELALHPAMASGPGRGIGGTNRIEKISGQNFTAADIGRKIYFNEGLFIIASVVDASTVTVTTSSGGAYTFDADVTDVWRICFISGRGKCRIVGNSIQHIEGDPFLLYFNDSSFQFYVNGVRKVLTARPSIYEYTTSTLGDVENGDYEYFFDANNQWSTFRLHATEQDAENLAMYATYDGYWIQAQYGQYGKYRKIRLSSGERRPGVKFQQIVLHPNGDITLGGNYEAESLRVLNNADTSPANRFQLQGGASGVHPTLSARGRDPNVGLILDAQGTSGRALRVSNNNFNNMLFEVHTDHFRSMLLPQYSNDTDAATGGIPIGGWYQNLTSGAIRQRRS